MKWNYINITDKENYDELLFSGWKIYVYGRDINDSRYISCKLLDLMRDYNITCKIATEDVIRRNSGLNNIAWGIGVIYLHSELFINQLISNILCDINYQLKDYNTIGCYPGAYKLNDILSIRYDFNISVDADNGLIYNKYIDHYRGEYGRFNINNNQIPKQLITNTL